jgi:non-homologous end joining protein Ku
VSCPIYLSPATSRTKPIGLRQVWRLAPENGAEDEALEPSLREEFTEPSLPELGGHGGGYGADQRPAITPVMIRPHDPRTGEEIDKAEVVKGYEYGRGQFITFTPEELKTLDIESSKVIDLEKFGPRGDLDPVYFDTPFTSTRMARSRRKRSG